MNDYCMPFGRVSAPRGVPLPGVAGCDTPAQLGDVRISPRQQILDDAARRERVVGDPGVAGRIDHDEHPGLDLNVIARHIEGLLKPAEGDNVVSLDTAKRSA